MANIQIPGSQLVTIGENGQLTSPRSSPPPAGGIMNPGFNTTSVLTKQWRKTVTVEGKPDNPPGLGKPEVIPGSTIPYIIGQQRIPVALVSWYGNLRAVEKITKEITNSTTQHLRTFETYFNQDNFLTTDTVTVTKNIIGWQADVVLLLCLGPGTELLTVFNDDEPVWQGNLGVGRHVAQWSDKSLLSQDMIWHSGEYDQAPDPYMQTWVDPNVSGFPGISYLILRGLSVTSNFPNLTFEVRRRMNPLGLPDNVNEISYQSACGPARDMNLATMAYEILSNEWVGVGVSEDAIDKVSFTQTAMTLAEEGNCGALYNQDDTSGAKFLQLIEGQANGVIFVNHHTGKVEFRLYRKPANTSDAFELSPSNILTMTQLSKQAWDSLPNALEVTHTDRCGSYVAGSLPLEMLTADGTIKKEERVEYPLAMDFSIAQKCAIRDMPYLTTPMWSFSSEVTREAAHLMPGDLVNFSWPDYRISNAIAAVTSKVESKANGQVTLEYFVLLEPYSYLIVDGEVTQFTAPDPNPKPPSRARVVSSPFWLSYLAGFNYRYFGFIDRDVPLYLVDRANEYQQKFDISQYDHPLTPGEWMDYDSSIGYSSIGVLVTPISAEDGWETGVIPEIEINDVRNDFYVQTQGLVGAKAGRAFLVIDNEFFAYEEAEKTGDHSWKLKRVHRALFGGEFVAHAANSLAAMFANDYRNVGNKSFSFDSGDPVHLKALSWGVRRRETSVEDDGLMLPDWTPTDQLGKPYRPDNTTINGVRSLTPVVVTHGVEFEMTWAGRNRSVLDQVPFMDDPGHPQEIGPYGGAWQFFVYLEDADGERLVGSSPEETILITPDNTWIPGPAKIWVATLTEDGRLSAHADKLPITISAT